MPAPGEDAREPAPVAAGVTAEKSADINIGDVTEFILGALSSKPDIENRANETVAFVRARIELSNRLIRQAFRYRGILFYFLLGLLTVETLFLFVIVFATAKPDPRLIISDTTLQITVGATIAQISTMVIVIIKSVFPTDMKQLIDVSKEIADLK